MRWTSRRKAEVVLAIEKNFITTAEANERYELSDEELAAWMRDYAAHGIAGLRATRLRQYHPNGRPAHKSQRRF